LTPLLERSETVVEGARKNMKRKDDELELVQPKRISLRSLATTN
jgi:hypothetical protein